MMAMAGRKKFAEGHEAGPDEEAESEERDATEPGESSEERKHGGRMRAHGGGITDGLKKNSGYSPKEGTHEAEGSENVEQEGVHTEHKRGGRTHRKHGGGVHSLMHSEHEKKPEEIHKMRHKRAKGGKVPGKAAKSHPGRRARGGGLADLNPYTAAGKMSEPGYQRGQTNSTEAGKGADTVGVNGRGRD